MAYEAAASGAVSTQQAMLADEELARQLAFQDFGGVPVAGAQACAHCGCGLFEDGNCTACSTYRVRCPWGDCGNIYEVRSKDVNCAVFRCGGCQYWGRFYQFPKHGSRADVLGFLRSAGWKGRTWEGWPGEVQGCGRPFRCPREVLVFSDVNDGEKLAWDDGQLCQEAVAAYAPSIRCSNCTGECLGREPGECDPGGDYSHVGRAFVDAMEVGEAPQEEGGTGGDWREGRTAGGSDAADADEGS